MTLITSRAFCDAKNCDDGSGQDNEMDWTNQSGEAYWDIGIDGMSESVRMEKMDQKC